MIEGREVVASRYNPQSKTLPKHNEYFQEPGYQLLNHEGEKNCINFSLKIITGVSLNVTMFFFYGIEIIVCVGKE